MDPRAANSGVLVTYDSAAAVAVTLPRLREQLAAGDQLVVVDNASSDDTVAVVRHVAPGPRSCARSATRASPRAVSRQCASTPTVDLPATAEAGRRQLAIP